MKQRNSFSIRLNSINLTLGMPRTLASRLTGGDEQRLDAPLNASELSVRPDGFMFVIDNDVTKEPEYDLLYAPEHFNEFLQDTGLSNYKEEDLAKLDTIASQQLLHTFSKWCTSKEASRLKEEIEAGELTFEDVRDVSPQVFNVPSFAQFHAAMFKQDMMPKRKAGKRTKYLPEVEDLYALACRIYRESPGMSFESACAAATEKRPDLVPRSWLNDPDGNLKRAAARYWDKSRHSQLSYRQRRDG